jgi:hypothetical protein
MARKNVMQNVVKLRSMQRGSEQRDPKAGKFFAELYKEADSGSKAERALSLADRYGRQRQIGAFKKEMAKEYGKGTKDYEYVTKYAKRSGK